ncbi:MAG: polysaccharide export protein EpsE [Burkholderiales bacterium]|nr:polysaccharide export protein EpsE [Burkholderiales bacterium]
MRYFLKFALLFFLAVPIALAQPARVEPAKVEPVLGPGDVVKVSVFQNPDLAVEARISEGGQINVPLIGAVTIGGLTISAAERRIETMLREGGFVLRPQVTIQTLRILSSQISVLGQVGKPGRYPIELVSSKVSEMIAAAGGVVPGGADIVTLVGTRNGQPVKLDIDLPAILQSGRAELDVQVENGDIIYVDRAPTVYIYGEVQRPGQLRLERGMTLMQALAAGGGLTARGTERGIRVHRRDSTGQVKILEVRPNDLLQRDDVVYVKESLF